MFKKPKTVCDGDDCKEMATYGIIDPKHCEDHKTSEEICLLVQKCKGCDREKEILNKDGLCLTYCKPNEIFQEQKREKKWEKLTLSYLDKYVNLPIKIVPADDMVIDSFCNKRRPDRVYDCGTHFVVVEIDENQHKGYSKEDNCELVRMHQIYEAVGMHTVFLRFNPNNFRVEGKLQKVNMQKRLELLTKWVEKCVKTLPVDEHNKVQYKFLYYDEFDQTDISFKILNDLEIAK
jgi:hypothetical protein